MNHNYQCIIAGVDLNPKSDDLTITKAMEMAKIYKAKLYLVHAVDTLSDYGTSFGYPTLNNVADEISAEHKQQLLAEIKKYNVNPDQLVIGMGSPSTVLLDNAKHLKADLIVVGLHTRHGLSALLGVTAKNIITDANCDVLTVNLTR
jgi:universal stress protein A